MGQYSVRTGQRDRRVGDRMTVPGDCNLRRGSAAYRSSPCGVADGAGPLPTCCGAPSLPGVCVRAGCRAGGVRRDAQLQQWAGWLRGHPPAPPAPEQQCADGRQERRGGGRRRGAQQPGQVGCGRSGIAQQGEQSILSTRVLAELADAWTPLAPASPQLLTWLLVSMRRRRCREGTASGRPSAGTARASGSVMSGERRGLSRVAYPYARPGVLCFGRAWHCAAMQGRVAHH